MKRELFVFSSIAAIVSLCNIYVCAVIVETLPVVTKALSFVFGGNYGGDLMFEGLLSGIITMSLIVMFVSIGLAVWAFISKNKEEKI